MKVDSYEIKQYENQRIVSHIELLEPVKKGKKYVLAYVESLRGNYLVPVKDITKDEE